MNEPESLPLEKVNKPYKIRRGGLYLIAYSLFYLGTQVYSGEQISIVQQPKIVEETFVEERREPFSLLPR